MSSPYTAFESDSYSVAIRAINAAALRQTMARSPGWNGFPFDAEEGLTLYVRIEFFNPASEKDADATEWHLAPQGDSKGRILITVTAQRRPDDEGISIRVPLEQFKGILRLDKLHTWSIQPAGDTPVCTQLMYKFD